MIPPPKDYFKYEISFACLKVRNFDLIDAGRSQIATISKMLFRAKVPTKRLSVIDNDANFSVGNNHFRDSKIGYVKSVI